MKKIINSTLVELMQGDITLVQVDAIVNAANSSLLGGSGVDGAIHRKGGSAITNECQDIRRRQGGCKVGEAVITGGGNLPAKYVIHAVGPVWSGGGKNEEDLLKSAYRNSLDIACREGIESIAFPNISTGIYRFPKERAAHIAIQTVFEYVMNSDCLQKVIFVCYDEQNYSIYRNYF